MTAMTEEEAEKELPRIMEMFAARRTLPPVDHSKYRYQLVHFNDLKPGPTSPYIVEGIIPLDGLVAVWGPPKCGKSFWVFDLVMHIALDRPYRGRRVRYGTVVYLAFEGAEGFKNRAEAFRRTHGVRDEDNAEFYLLGSNAKLVRDHAALIESIDAYTFTRPPAVIVLDTLNRSIDGSESKDQDMGAYLAAAEAICEEFGCVVIIVHHCGVDGSRPRGHTSLTGAAAAQIAVRRDAGRNVVAEVEAMKDGAEGACFTSALKVVEVGTDKDGKPITSCVIVPVEGAAAGASKAKAPKLSPAAKLALDQLGALVASGASEAPPASNHIPANVRVCSAVLWRENFYKAHIGDKLDTKQKAFVRAVERLQELHLIGLWSDKAWLCNRT